MTATTALGSTLKGYLNPWQQMCFRKQEPRRMYTTSRSEPGGELGTRGDGRVSVPTSVRFGGDVGNGGRGGYVCAGAGTYGKLLDLPLNCAVILKLL